ncbi:MAG TPA: alternative ribosome rescue aminoacyl-tRNA hydrolase ArfB [Bdellovibrionota bacterium]|jgi:ribosome-associated protein|nr:alternative ribosome rescue aminoacyl-tRNA hydrolase ArfB [Bdellovibrionota bacterium]
MKPSPAAFEIPRDRVEVRAARSGGSGGQHVNKVETKIEIRFSLDDCDWIPPDVQERLRANFNSRINKAGEFLVSSEASRSQNQNLEDAFKKLREMILSCWYAPKKRIKSKPTRSSREKRLKTKRVLSDKKKSRSGKPDY